ncbi:hypothetical protein [Bacillus sp. FJAT-45350]|uniref:hypothetical protein n=1 Tax=Bacillus sp. FJAT-45350 TaxID=2011014 RepID=UPI000BB819C7|nr:hypothetical protein [Bacillus sp. FJAT-45350]
MNSKRDVFVKRNKLLSNLVWGAFILGLVSNFISNVPLNGLIAYSIAGLIASIVISTFAYRELIPFHLQYIVAIAFLTLTFVMGITSPKLSNYLMVYVSLVFITLYHNYRSIALSGIGGLLLTNYFFLTLRDTMFVGLGGDTAMVEEVFASVEEQHEYIENVVNRFNELEEMNEKLSRLVHQEKFA